MLAQLPSNMLITRVKPSVYLPAAAFVWSAISAATAGCTSAAGLWAVQSVLGIAEAPLFPGAVFLMACCPCPGVSGLIAAGVFAGLDGPMGLAGWQWLFILEGAASALFAITAYFIVPNYPHSDSGGACWYMTAEMRQLAAARILDDRVEVSEKFSILFGVKLAVKDVKLFQNYSHFPAHDCSSLRIGNSLHFLRRLGYVACDSDRRQDLGWHIIIPLSCSVVGIIITVATGNPAARYAMTFLYAAGCFSANTLQYTWAVSTLGQTPEKLAAGGAIVNICGHLGNVISPYFFPDSDAPRYTMAMIPQILYAGLCITLVGFIKLYLTSKNKKLREKAERLGIEYNPFTI